MNQISGSVTFSGSLGYCQQNAWIQNLSVRENILFGAPFDEDRYWRAVKAAALPSDLELFADGDMTEIGERGVNLSGGQKSRLNIARAFYSDADIILLDDPLSAVDAPRWPASVRRSDLGAESKWKDGRPRHPRFAYAIEAGGLHLLHGRR
jgi:ATP-binding cassette subfamily C (CFTR/MRP) protein 1